MNTSSYEHEPASHDAEAPWPLRIDGLCKRYGSFELKDISLDVEPGSIVGLIGSNGAGKTTTVKSALGVAKPDAGTIRLFGTDINTVSRERFAEIKQDIGIVFDSCSFPEEYRVENAARAMRFAYRNWDNDTFERLAQKFQLPKKKQVSDLSRGMGMKLSLACALAHKPRLLILDEVTAGLDPIARDDVLDLLRAYLAEDETRAILLSSHITSDLDKTADRIVCIDEGRIAFAVEKDAIDMAGIALCRKADVATIAESGAYSPGGLRVERDAYATRILVPDRFAFAEAFPGIAVEAANVETFMHFMLRGSSL